MKNKIVYLIITIGALFTIGAFWIFLRNMNNEVVSAFDVMNEKLDKSNAIQQQRIDSLYNQITIAISRQKADRLDSISNDLIQYIEQIKTELITIPEIGKDYSKMDKSNVVDSLFFEAEGYTQKGHEFVDRLSSYKSEVKATFIKDFPEVKEMIDTRIIGREDLDDWLDYHFKGFPLIASLTKLTQIQLDVETIRRKMFRVMTKK